MENPPVDLRRLEFANFTLRGWMLGYGFGVIKNNFKFDLRSV
jgi:hypothetical protein